MVKDLLDSIEMGRLAKDPDIIAALEGLDMNDLFKNIVQKTEDFEAWIAADPCNGYHFVGMESAFINDRSIFKGAWIRFKMAFSLNRDKAMAEYVSVLRDVDTARLNAGDSDNVLLNKDNIKAFDELMNLMSTLNTDALSKDATNILKKTSEEVDSYTKKILLAFLVIYVPIINLVAVIMLIVAEKNFNGKNQATYAQHSELLQKSISDVIKKSKLGEGLGLTYEKNGNLNMESISKISSKINKLKMRMLPVKARGTELPRWFKSKQYISYDEKIEVIGMVQQNADKYISSLGSTPTGMTNALRVIMSAEKMQQMFDYGVQFENNMTIENAYASLATTMFLAFIDVTTTAMILTQDLKRY